MTNRRALARQRFQQLAAGKTNYQLTEFSSPYSISANDAVVSLNRQRIGGSGCQPKIPSIAK